MRFWTVGITTLFLSCAIHAAPITYTFSGSGTGTIGASDFTDANFLVTLTGDTTDLDIFANLGNILGNESLSGNIAINGVGAATFTSQLFIYDFASQLGFGTFESGNLIAINNPDFVGYGLATDLGPVAGTNVILSQFHDVATSLGTLTYSSMSTVTFNASTTTAVPEPASFVTSGAMIGVLFFLRRIASKHLPQRG